MSQRAHREAAPTLGAQGGARAGSPPGCSVGGTSWLCRLWAASVPSTKCPLGPAAGAFAGAWRERRDEGRVGGSGPSAGSCGLWCRSPGVQAGWAWPARRPRARTSLCVAGCLRGGGRQPRRALGLTPFAQRRARTLQYVTGRPAGCWQVFCGFLLRSFPSSPWISPKFCISGVAGLSIGRDAFLAEERLWAARVSASGSSALRTGLPVLTLQAAVLPVLRVHLCRRTGQGGHAKRW